MKTFTFKTMMIAGMMIMGTVTTFGKTNAKVHNNRNHNTRTEVVVGLRTCSSEHQWSARANHSMFDRYMHPGMDRRFFINHIMEGRHIFGRNHECKVCHLTKHQIHEVEKDLRHSHHTPVGRPVSFRR